MRKLAAAVAFVVVSIGVYLGLAVVVVVAFGGVSCYQVCTPAQEFLESSFPLPAILAGVVALACGALAARRVAR